MHKINETHDINLKSWVESANDPNTDFPIQNLPFCIFHYYQNFNGNKKLFDYQMGVVIGDKILNLTSCCENGLFEDDKYGELLRYVHDKLKSLASYSEKLSELRELVSKML
ncbi:MAG: hypothetical protein MUC29_12785, partial [Pyrinomonadaceae bacterium]|nr:hypothetical protein [Pyrinomonadaceae bacterium]